MGRAIARRLADEEAGFTLLELLNVVLILSILMLTAVPTYMTTRDKAYKAAAATNVKNLVATARLYAADNSPNSANDPNRSVSTTDSGYAGMTVAALSAYNSTIGKAGFVNNSGIEASGVTMRAPLDATHFCVYSVQGRWYGWQLNASGAITISTDVSKLCTT